MTERDRKKEGEEKGSRGPGLGSGLVRVDWRAELEAHERPAGSGDRQEFAKSRSGRERRVLISGVCGSCLGPMDEGVRPTLCDGCRRLAAGTIRRLARGRL